MDPLVQIEYIAGGSGVLAGGIAAMTTLLMSYVTGRQAVAKEKRDYARQDEVAARLMRSNAVVADNAANTFGKLDNIAATAKVIHTLVNSDLTKAIQGELDATIIQMSLAEQVIALYQKSPVRPPQEVLGIVAACKDKIATLQADLAQRAKQQDRVDLEENIAASQGTNIR
jgi:hypothetical protein